MKTAVIIPAFNEEKTISRVLNNVIDCAYQDYIILIDDNSTDNTYEIALQQFGDRIVILHHDVNLGKGAALKTGCEAAIKLGVDYIICMDADDQHNPIDIIRLIEKINDGYDIVFGSRIIGKGMPLMKFIGNKFLSIIICFLFKILIHDTQSGFRAFTKETYQLIKWDSNDYAVETEMIVKTSENKIKFCEIEIATTYHDNYKGTTPINGIEIFFKILKWKFL